MTVFDELKSKVTETAKTAMQKSNEFVEVTKLSISVSDANTRVDRLLRDIGKMIYIQHLDGESLDNDITKKCNEADLIYEQIKELKEKIAELKKIKVCPHCDNENQTDALFCSKCGKQISDI